MGGSPVRKGPGKHYVYDDREPQHEVDLSEYFIGKYPVTWNVGHWLELYAVSDTDFDLFAG